MITIKHAHGTTETVDTFNNALVALREVYGVDIVVDAEDIVFGRGLVWRDEESAQNDDGSRAVASLKESVTL